MQSQVNLRHLCSAKLDIVYISLPLNFNVTFEVECVIDMCQCVNLFNYFKHNDILTQLRFCLFLYFLKIVNFNCLSHKR